VQVRTAEQRLREAPPWMHICILLLLHGTLEQQL
jgi:hypothetical protein